MKPLKGVKWPECPVTGLIFPENEGIWSRGRLTSRQGYDAPGYNEEPDETAPDGLLDDEREPSLDLVDGL